MFTDSPSTSPAFASSCAVINLSALAHNLGVVRRHVAPACRIMAVVKADAYGHGAIEIARALTGLDITCFGVATVPEGAALRRAGVAGDIVVLGGIFPEQIPELLEAGLTPVIHRAGLADELASRIPPGRRPVPVHVKIDTGMTRLGLAPDEVRPCAAAITRAGALRLEGLMTHLASADEEGSYTGRQLGLFGTVVEALKAAGHEVRWLHAANSAGILSHPRSHLTMVRPGLMLYGYAGSAEAARELRPVLSLSTRVMQVRRVPAGQPVSYNAQFTTARASTLAVLAIGYADGYPRLLSNRGAVLIRGRRAPIVGRVCMDLTIVDVTDVPGVTEGDEAVLIGRQGAEQISAVDVAEWAETIPYEILTGIGPRVLRVYRRETPH